MVALIVTIIILLILAGITIATLTGRNGIIDKANLAGEETKKKEYEELLKIIGNGLKPDKIINNWDAKTYLDEFEKEIEKEDKFKGSEINRKNDETIIIITKEGYGYKITEDEVKYIGKQGENEAPSLEESNITFTYKKSPGEEEKEWTNKNVMVEISSKTTEYELQYSMDGSSWDKYRNRNYDGRKWTYLCKTS